MLQCANMMARLLGSLVAFILLVGCGDDKQKPKAEAWLGKTFVLDTAVISNPHWRKPVNLAPVMGTYAQLPQFLLGIEAGSGDDLLITLSTGRSGSQDTCTATTQVTARGADYPQSTISVLTFPMRISSKAPAQSGTLSITAHDVTFKDILPGMESLATAQFNATFDVAEIYPIVAPAGTKELVCQTLEASGDACETCPFNGEPYCMSVEAVQVGAQEAPNPIKVITATDIPVPCP